ncbi:MAG: M48 family metallopeptidase [Alphaproteobacteria bacterium]|nr:M48 family metallopeptidase [Alphaproteobacteria bacterium]
MAVSAQFYDGQTARMQVVNVTENGTSISFSGPETSYTNWTIKGLHAIDPAVDGQPYRLTHEDKPGARLIIRDQAFISALISKSSHLRGGYSARDIGHIIGWTVGGLAAVLVTGYLTMTLLPEKAAHMLPNAWKARVGKQMETAMVEGAKLCRSPKGDEALAAMIGNLAEGTPDLPPISVHIYDMNVLNAFAVSGGNIILTRELIDKADGPDELAGVLAHEIGHVAHLDPEAQLVRLTGLQVLTSVFTGSNGGDMTTNLAFLATVLKFTREAEAKADAYARETMIKARINPLALKTFFEKILKLEGDKKSGNAALTGLGGLFSTHPGTENRIKEIQPLPAGVVARPSLTDEQWKALKDICKG